jgi:glycosyltransferase involved in cell wall biosynthesis
MIAPVASTATCRRVCVLSEDLSGAPDEGIKNFSLAIARALNGTHDVTLISTRGDPASVLAGVCFAPTSRAFLGGRLRATLRRAAPDVILYVPTASTTLMSFVRSRLLKAYCPKAQVVLIGLQPRQHTGIQEILVRHLLPDRVWVQTRRAQQHLLRLGCQAGLIGAGVDTETFHPVEGADRRALREHYGVPLDAHVVLHVGHLAPSRGIAALARIAAQPACHVVLVASSSTTPDVHLAENLRLAGVRCVHTYQVHIEHWYQLADCYVFPVPPDLSSAIDVPLSVLEALACELPVVTTRFGALWELLGTAASPALRFVDDLDGLVAETVQVSGSPVPLRADRSLVAGFAWSTTAARLVDAAIGLDARRTT